MQKEKQQIHCQHTNREMKEQKIYLTKLKIKRDKENLKI